MTTGDDERVTTGADGWEYPADLLHAAWALIANASGGRWEEETPEWQAAARRWRDAWHATLPRVPR